MNNPIIKIIGPTGSFKTTLAQRIALHLLNDGDSVTVIDDLSLVTNKQLEDAVNNGLTIICTTPEWDIKINIT